LRSQQIKTLEQANRFLSEQYMQQFNQRFSKPASQRGTAFVPLRRKDLDLVFSLQHERIVARDNTVSFANKIWQLERCKLRTTLAGCRVTIHQHLDQTVSITFGPHLVGSLQRGGRAAPVQDEDCGNAGKVTPKSGLTFPQFHSHY
jgi:hypothetical protein